MRGPTHARFVAIGKERPDFVDKGRQWGRAFTEAVSPELAGIPPTYSCDVCDVTLTVSVEANRSNIRKKHLQSARHKRLSGN